MSTSNSLEFLLRSTFQRSLVVAFTSRTEVRRSVTDSVFTYVFLWGDTCLLGSPGMELLCLLTTLGLNCRESERILQSYSGPYMRTSQAHSGINPAASPERLERIKRFVNRACCEPTRQEPQSTTLGINRSWYKTVSDTKIWYHFVVPPRNDFRAGFLSILRYEDRFSLARTFKYVHQTKGEMEVKSSWNRWVRFSFRKDIFSLEVGMTYIQNHILIWILFWNGYKIGLSWNAFCAWNFFPKLILAVILPIVWLKFYWRQDFLRVAATYSSKIW